MDDTAMITEEINPIWALLQPSVNEYLDFLANNWVWVAAVVFLTLVMVGSGAIASSIAEWRQRGPLLHFCLGFLLPVIYPFAVKFMLPTWDPDEVAKQKKAKTARAPAPPEPGAPPVVRGLEPLTEAPEPVTDAPVPAGPVVFNEQYFSRISRDESGNLRGPFRIVLDGQEIRAERIVDVLPQNVIVETMVGGKVNRMRLPFGKIEVFEELK